MLELEDYPSPLTNSIQMILFVIWNIKKHILKSHLIQIVHIPLKSCVR